MRKKCGFWLLGSVIAASALLPIGSSPVFAGPSADQVGQLDRVAGRPQDPGFSGDGGPARSARLYQVRDVVAADDGTLYISDMGNHRIRRVSPSGVITTIAGDGTAGSRGDGGPAISARLNVPHNITLSPDGRRLVIADAGNYRVREIDLHSGIIRTIAGTGAKGGSGDGGTATAAQLDWPAGVTFLKDGSLLISEATGARVRKVSPAGIITRIAGTGSAGNSGNGGPATKARLNGPRATAEGPDGSIYIGEEVGNRVRRIAPDGTINVFAGTGAAGYTGDGGPASQAQLDDVRDLELVDGYLYIADNDNAAVRRVNLASGTITTVAGTGTPGWVGDNRSATTARFANLRGIDIRDNWLYIAEENPAVHRVGLATATPTSPPVRPGIPAGKTDPTPIRVGLRAKGRASKLKVNVVPNREDGNYKFVVQRKQGGTWRNWVTRWTKGTADTRTINLRRGWYRIVVRAQYGLSSGVSGAVRLLR